LIHVPDVADDWKALFHELWTLRYRFVGSMSHEHAISKKFRLAVFCRMRPNAGPRDATVSVLSLPLHQRVALLREREPNFSQQEALRFLLSKDTEGICSSAALDASVEDKSIITVDFTDAAAAPSKVSPDVDVADIGSGFSASVLAVSPGASGSVLTVSSGIGLRNWDFDHVFGESTQQAELHHRCGHRLTTSLLNGRSGALVVYGQTGSGKTHTMFGPPREHDAASSSSMGTAARASDGLVPRIAEEVFHGMEKRREVGLNVYLLL
jgi:hypothetical protein